MFLAGGAGWVLLTDVLLYRLVTDPMLIGRLETAKGWTFVMLGTALLYGVTLVSARRIERARAATAAVLDSIGDGVLLLGKNRAIEQANPAAVAMLRCDELVGMDAQEFARRFRVSYPDGSLVPPERYASQRAFDEAGPLQYKAVLHPPGGPPVVISATSAAVLSGDAPPEMVVSVMHDITASEHLEQMRDDFFSTAAHTLKTPVAIIKANAQLLSACGSAEMRQVARAIDRQCAGLDRLVQNLLVFTRSRTRTLQLHVERVELATLVEAVTDKIAVAGDADLQVSVSAKPRIHADAERFGLALQNVIEDAMHRARCVSTAGPVIVRVLERGRDAVIAIRHAAPDRPLEQVAVEEGDLRLGRAVAETVIAAHGGTLHEERDGVDHVSYITLPAVEAAHEHA